MRTFSRICILSVLLLIFSVSTTTAQLRFGVKGGVDVTNNRINKDILDADNRLGFQIGGTLEFMAPIVALGGELSVIYGLQKGDENLRPEVTGSIPEYELSDYHYLRVPLNLKKKFSIVGLVGVFISAGPYVEFKLSGADFEEKGNIEKQYKSKSFGAGVNAGAGIELMNHLEIGMYYRKSLTNNYDEDTPSIGDIWKKHPENWTVGLTYFF